MCIRDSSGTNTQPWQAYVLKGDALKKLIDASCQAFNTDRESHTSEQPYYPKKWMEPYLSRRRKIGWDLYGLLGIERGEHEKMHNQHRRNFEFFDAPVGIIFTIHRDLVIGSWLDYGMYLQNVMLLAREAGLHTCPQAAWADFHRVIRDVIPEIGEDETVVCGMCLGYADHSAIENTLVTVREDLDDYVSFLK